MFYDRGNHHDFLSLVRQLQPPGELSSTTTFSFEFTQVEKPYESYTGTNVRLRYKLDHMTTLWLVLIAWYSLFLLTWLSHDCRYFLRVVIVRRLADISKELDVAVHTLSQFPDMNNSLKMEVGIEDCLHIEFEYNKAKWVSAGSLICQTISIYIYMFVCIRCACRNNSIEPRLSTCFSNSLLSLVECFSY